MVELLKQQPWGDKSHRYHMSREEEYKHSLEAMVGIWYVILCLHCCELSVSATAADKHLSCFFVGSS